MCKILCVRGQVVRHATQMHCQKCNLAFIIASHDYAHACRRIFTSQASCHVSCLWITAYVKTYFRICRTEKEKVSGVPAMKLAIYLDCAEPSIGLQTVLAIWYQSINLLSHIHMLSRKSHGQPSTWYLQCITSRCQIITLLTMHRSCYEDIHVLHK